MAKELQRIDVTNLPELLRIAEEVRSTGEPRVLRRRDEDLAVVMPAKKQSHRVPRGKLFTRDNPLWNIVGIGQSQGPTDVSANKHKYLADAYLHKHL